MDARLADQPRLRSFSLPDRGGVMAALDFGPEARPIDIVFSHANGFNARTYRTILAPLATSLRILALDLRGHGLSTLPADAATFPGWGMFADDLAALLAQAVERPVILAGHSLGATTSLLCAARAPDRIRNLVLFEPVMADPTRPDAPSHGSAMAAATLRRRSVFPDRAAALAAYKGRGAFSSWDEALVRDYVAAGLHDTADGQVALACDPAWEAVVYAEQDYDPLAALEALRCPVRIIASAVGGSSVGLRARAFLKAAGTPFEVVPATSHFLPMERPEVVREALLAAFA